MRIISTKVDIPFNVAEGEEKIIERGKEYIIPDMFVEEFSSIYGSKFLAKNSDFDEVYKGYDGTQMNNKTLFCFRTGGVGDIFFMIAGIGCFKKKYPDSKVIAGCAAQNIEVLRSCEYVDEVITLPYEYELAKKADYQLFFEGLIEDNEEAKYNNAYDLFISKFHIDPKNVDRQDKIPKIKIKEDVLEGVGEVLKSVEINTKEDYVIGLQVSASSPIRDYPTSLAKELISNLLDKGLKIIILGSVKEGGELTRKLELDHSDKRIFGSFRITETLDKLFATIHHCDAVVGIDSSSLHIAGALGKPLLGLFGAFESDLRLQYFNNAIALQAQTECGPCFLHGMYPCRKSLKDCSSACMHLIRPENITKILLEEVLPLSRKGGAI